MKTYMVFPSNGETARTHKAVEAVVEPSGALALYGNADGVKPHLVYAYAKDTWKTISLVPNE